MDGFEGASPESLRDAVNHSMNGCLIHAPKGSKGTVRLIYRVEDAVPNLTAQLKIEAKEGSETEVYLLFEGDAPTGSVNIAEYIEAEKDAKVTIKKIQFNGDSVRHIKSIWTEKKASSSIMPCM